MNRKIIEQVLRLAEKQYRKGFQHGAHQAVGLGERQQADDFRRAGEANGYTRPIDQEGRVWSKWVMAERLSAECVMENMDELRELLDAYADRRL